MTEYEKQMEKQFKYLDQIDIERYMKNCTTKKIGDVISAIERDYNNTDFTNNDCLEGYIFNWLDEEEFIEYLERRFGERFSYREIEVYYNTFRLD